MASPRPLPPSATRWRLIAASFAALAILVIMLEVFPRWSQAASVFSAWRTEAALLAEANPEATLRQLDAERAALVAEADRALVDLPRSGELASVLFAIEEASQEAGAVLVEVEPGEAESRPGVEVLPVRVAVRGDGHTAGQFVSAIERSDLLLSVRAVTVTGPGLEQDPTTTEVLLEALQARTASPRAGESDG